MDDLGVEKNKSQSREQKKQSILSSEAPVEGWRDGVN
jgi:hypothetical protein